MGPSQVYIHGFVVYFQVESMRKYCVLQIGVVYTVRVMKTLTLTDNSAAQWWKQTKLSLSGHLHELHSAWITILNFTVDKMNLFILMPTCNLANIAYC